MAWSEVIDQQRVVASLRRALERGRVAHAYLFIGPDGVGKRAVALALAQALECAQDGADPCGACAACSKVRRMIHPDVHVLIPYPTDVSTDEVTERLQMLGEDPYTTVDFVRRASLADPTTASNKQAFYSIARINDDLRRSMGFKPLEGRNKVVILTDAELMRIEAANAFLKLLEEPPPQTVFILTTSRPDRLLPTILSRCQRLRFDPLPSEAIEAALQQRKGVEPAYAAALARMADGSYSRALDLAGNAELMASRELCLEFLRQAYTHNVGRMADLVEQLARMGRERLKGLFDLMLRWIRDLLLFRIMGREALLVNVDQREAIEKFCTNIPAADIESMILLVEEAIELIERNVHQTLVVTSLALALHRTMRGERQVRLYMPLVEA